MKGMDIMKAMNDLDHDMLQEAEAAPVKSIRKPRLSWFGIIAAAVALLTVTAAAVGITVSISVKHGSLSVDPDDLKAQYFEAVNGEIPGTKVDIDFGLTVTELDEKHAYKVKFVTSGYWKEIKQSGVYDFIFDDVGGAGVNCVNFGYGHNYSGYEYSFKCVEDIEDFLGIQLKLNSEIREAAAKRMPYTGDQIVMISTVSKEKGDKEYAETKGVSPAGIQIHIPVDLKNPPVNNELITEYGPMAGGRGDTVTVSIYIALDEEYLARYNNYSAFFPDRSGTFHMDENVSFDGKKLTMFYSSDGVTPYNTMAQVAYCEDGIGYVISAIDLNSDGDAVELLKPYLKNWD